MENPYLRKYMMPFYRLMLITNKGNIPLPEYLDFIKECADSGITSLQLREKSLSFNELVDFGEYLKETLSPYNIPLIINDFPLLAKALKTPYIHLGQSDGSVENALSIMSDIQIGISIDTIENMHEANCNDSLAYVTASAIFSSNNKNNIKTVWGLLGLKKLSLISKHPLTAIGGITLNNISDVLTHGAKGIALIGEIHNAKNKSKTVKEFRQILNSYLGV